MLAIREYHVIHRNRCFSHAPNRREGLSHCLAGFVRPSLQNRRFTQLVPTRLQKTFLDRQAKGQVPQSSEAKEVANKRLASEPAKYHRKPERRGLLKPRYLSLRIRILLLLAFASNQALSGMPSLENNIFFGFDRRVIETSEAFLLRQSVR